MVDRKPPRESGDDGRPKTVTETVDIGAKSNQLETYSEGSLDRLDQSNRIKAKWFRERVIVLLSVTVILATLVASLVALGYSEDDASRNWARQMIATLLGFAAGSIWESRKGGD